MTLQRLLLVAEEMSSMADASAEEIADYLSAIFDELALPELDGVLRIRATKSSSLQ